MRKNLFRHVVLLAAAILSMASFWSCKKNELPDSIAVIGVSLDKTSITITVGSTETLTATIEPEDADNQNITWASDNPEVATVNEKGKVTGIKAGKAVITVITEDGEKTATCKVTVKDKEINVTEVKLNKTETTILVGASETLVATVLPEDATNQKVSWKSSDEAVATVDDKGKVTGVKAGEATITVTTEDGEKTATCKVTVTDKEVNVTEVKLNKTETTILVGASETLAATVLPENATNQKVSWKSSDEAVATVDDKGKVTGVKAGEATITVTTEDGGKTATCKVTVSDKEVNVTGVTLNKTETSILVGASETLVATVLPENATNQKVSWSSNKPEIASVDANGKVTGVKAGEAVITVTTEDGGKTATCKVSVNTATVAVTGVMLNKTETTILEGGSETLVATVLPENATNRNVSWKSSDEAVATVDANGKVTGVKAGEAVITVTTEDGKKTNTCNVTVKSNTVNVKGVVLNKTSISIPVGEDETLAAKVLPENATNQNVTWSCKNPEIASVDANGKVTGIKAGMTIVTVTTEDGGKTADCAVNVSERHISVIGVELNKTELIFQVGDSETLVASIKPKYASNEKVTWVSDKPEIATVDANGKVTGVKAGVATITVTTDDGGKTATCKVLVSPPVYKVTVTPATLTMGINETSKLNAKVEGKTGVLRKVFWTSSDETIATVDNNGNVTTKDKAGTVTITATSAANPTKKGTCVITVSANKADISYGGYGSGENW